MRNGTWASLLLVGSLAAGLAACEQSGTPEQPQTSQPRQEQPSQPGGTGSQPSQPGSPPSGGAPR